MVRTRIAPSPTGNDIHIGNLYTAYINWAYAKKMNGKFIIRIEDTDRERLVKGSEQKILASLNAYGLTHDEGPDIGGPFSPYRQSERLELYKKHAEELVKNGHAYYCICSRERLEELKKKNIENKRLPKYDRFCLHNQKDVQKKIEEGSNYVVRLKMPENRNITFKDEIRGDITFDSNTLDDQVLLKSDGFPTYHLGVVVDDHIMEISHIIRGEEWISSTPKHIILYEAFGWEKPLFIHMPVLRNPDKSKLSKRKNAVWSSAYLQEGFLPEAVLNFLALMGWSHPEQKEIFTKEEFIEKLELKDISPTGPAFDRVKLEWMNGEYIRMMSDDKLFEKIVDFIGSDYDSEVVKKSIPIIKERIKKLSDYIPLTEFLFKQPDIYDVDISSKREMLEKVAEELSNVTEWKAALIGEAMLKVAQELKVRNSEFFMVMRVAITGKKISPPLNESMEILGREKTLHVLKNCCNILI